MAHILRHLLRGRHVAAQRCQRLGEGTHVHVHLILQPEVAGGSTTALTQHAQSVGIVHHDPCAVLLGQRTNFRQLGDVAAHGEYAVCDDEGAVLLRHPLQLLLQIRHIAVAVAQHLAVAHLAPGVDGSVVLPVADHIVVPPHQCADDTHVGLEPCAEGDDAGLTQKLPQFLLQLQMHLEGAVEEPGATAPGAVLLQGMDARLHHIRGRGQTQIVVGTQHDAAPALHHHLHILPGLEGVEIGIHPRRLQFLRQRRLIAFLKNIHSSLLLCNIKY